MVQRHDPFHSVEFHEVVMITHNLTETVRIWKSWKFIRDFSESKQHVFL